MAGMFYSLQEVAGKLDKTEEEVKELVKDGKLREFRDGPNLLFKVDEVEALMSDTSIMASKDISAETEQKADADEDEIFLAPETPEAPAAEGELADADTIVSGEGISVLGETDSDYKLAGDAMDETKAASGETPSISSGEASLEEIEGDVNLDSFGSGSGLLDLSLQADDTSLGGILDEIYTPEGGEDQEAAADGSAMDVAAEAEQMLSEEEFAPAQPGAAVMVQAYAEPDTLSNAFGIMLFLPLLAVAYTAIVAVAGFNDIMPAILEKIQGIIWYIMGGVGGAAGLIVIAAFMLGRSGSKADKKPKAKKEKKAKKAKKPKGKTPEPAPESEIPESEIE